MAAEHNMVRMALNSLLLPPFRISAQSRDVRPGAGMVDLS